MTLNFDICLWGIEMTFLNYLRRRLVCRNFRTYFLLVIGICFICQSLLVYYLLTKVNETEGPTKFGPSNGQNHQVQFDKLEGNHSKCYPSKTALSAIKRATSEKCKEELSDIACRLKNHQLVPERLPNYCLRKDSVPGSSLGCFLDEKTQNPRLLPSYGVKSQSLTVQKCIDLCSQSSFPYAGVHNGKECYCGVLKPSLEHLLARTYCNLPCDGQSGQACGGVDATEVFDTAVPTRESAKLLAANFIRGTNSTTRIGFILTVNGRALRQVTRLLRIIYRPHHFYLIHVDARQDFLFRSLLQLELKYPNIRLIRKRQSSIWGGASLLDVLLQAMEQLLELDSKWRYVFNLSESDFPLRSIEELEAFLAANSGRNFLKSHGRQTRQFIHKQGLDRVFHQCESRMWRLGDRQLPAGVRIDGGSDWFGLTRELVEYATSYRKPGGGDPLLTGLKELYRYTLLPAESFFHVLVLNSRFCSSYADNNLRVTLWRRSQGCLCQHRNVVDWCGCSPMVFRTSDWPHLETIMNKSTVFFGRKFEAAIDQSVINRLEERLVNASLSHQGWDSYWESVYHTSDLSPKPNDALLAIAASLTRHSLLLMMQHHSDANCFVKPGRIISISSYFRLDHYQGDLILFNGASEAAQFEALVKPMSRTIFPNDSSPRSLSILKVGSDYDPKEQVLRNRLDAMSSFSKPVAIFKWTGHLNSTAAPLAQLAWFDPDHRLRAVHQVNISDTSKMGYQNLDLDEPSLTPGVWTLVAVYEQKKLASTEFLIAPLVGENPADYRASKDHPSQSLFEKKFPSDTKLDSKRRRHVELMMTDNQSYVDLMTAEFYSVQDVCYVSLPVSCAKPSTDWLPCSKTDWSSLSPDPKSSNIK